MILRWLAPLALAVPALTALALMPLTVRPASAQPSVDLVWQSRAATDAALVQELQDLYLPLFNSGTLTVRQVRLGDRLVEQLLRDEKVFFGDHFPVALDAMLCDMNPGLCSRPRTPVAQQTLADPAAHVGGFVPSYGTWRVQPDSRITIPDYRFDQETTLVRVPVADDWTPEAYTPPEGIDCSTWGSSCADVVKMFNPRQFKTRTTSATLPQARLTTRLTVGIAGASKYRDALSAIAPAAGPGVTVDRSILSEALRAQDEGGIDTLLDSLNRNLMPLGNVSKYGSSAEVDQPQMSSLFRAIRHPYAEGREIPEIYRGPVTVTVLDATIDQGHCDWKKTYLASGEELPRIDDPACNLDSAEQLSDRDHVALVAGLIAAQPNGYGAAGINPYADLNFLPLDSAVAPDMQIAALTSQLLAKIPRKTEIVNISAGFMMPVLGSADSLKQALTIHKSRVLFVVAAGNNNADLSDECPVLPACLNEFDNVVTVIGLTANVDDPTLWRSDTAGSNFSPKFALGAVAENVYSTVSGNRFGQMSGTSMAAAQVTATGSLILAASKRIWARELAGERIPPRFIKDRLIYTADILPGLAGTVLSGRLNVSRAMAVADDQFVLQDGRQIIGQVLAAPDDVACRTPIEAERIQKFYNLRRMTYLPESRRYFLFKHDTPALGARDAPLEAFPGCSLTTISPMVSVKVGLNQVVEFPFGEIVDYTSRFMETGQ
ncbi:MAG: S8 family serine peptidase [Pseudomonadota bacterium]